MAHDNQGGARGGRYNQGDNRYQMNSYQPYVFRPNFMKNTDGERKHSSRKVIDWTGACVQTLLSRRFKRSFKDRSNFQPLSTNILKTETPSSLPHLPANCVTTRFVRTATNKQKCPVYQIVWTPDGRRLVTGAASGEFTLWNGMAFNFETILQAHDQPVRAMSWSNDGHWLATGDQSGYIKYWQQNMCNCCMYQAHKDQPCRGISFAPTDQKFASCSDDGTVRVWDFYTRSEERILRGHGSDVKQVDWHPSKGIIASGSKDLQSPIKLWDPKGGVSITTLYAHKGTVMDIQWNKNGHWLASAARDHLVKIFDIRNLKQEYQILRGHKKEAFSLSWHPVHEGLISTGGSEGSIIFWYIGEEQPLGMVEGGHESLIWRMAWHPMGHVLATASNDHSTKFWSRAVTNEVSLKDDIGSMKGADLIADINKTQKAESGLEEPEEEIEIPGLGGWEEQPPHLGVIDYNNGSDRPIRTGLTLHNDAAPTQEIPAFSQERKKMYVKPVPKDYAKAWEQNKEGEVLQEQGGWGGGNQRPYGGPGPEMLPYGHRFHGHHDHRLNHRGRGHHHNHGGRGGHQNANQLPQQGSNYIQWDGGR